MAMEPTVRRSVKDRRLYVWAALFIPVIAPPDSHGVII